MKLSAYLVRHGIKRVDFAAAIGVTPGWVTSLCDESGWPSRETAERIAQATSGSVTPNDFIFVTQRSRTVSAKASALKERPKRRSKQRGRSPAVRATKSAGHFSRFRDLRIDRFRTAAEIEDYIDKLRDEWSHR